MVDNEDLLGQRLADGEESALEECYARYGPTVLAYLRRHVGPDDAEDVLQRTFLDVWRHWSVTTPGRAWVAGFS